MQLQQNSKITSSLINKNDRYILVEVQISIMYVVKCMLYTIKVANHK